MLARRVNRVLHYPIKYSQQNKRTKSMRLTFRFRFAFHGRLTPKKIGRCPYTMCPLLRFYPDEIICCRREPRTTVCKKASGAYCSAFHRLLPLLLRERAAPGLVCRTTARLSPLCPPYSLFVTLVSAFRTVVSQLTLCRFLVV